MFVFIIIIVFIILLQIVSTLTIKFVVKDYKLVLPKYRENIINKSSKIFLEIFVLKKIKVGKIDLKKRAKNITRIDNIVKKNGGIKSINLFEIIRKSDFEIEEMKLKIMIGTEDAAVTAIAVGTIASIIGIVLQSKFNNQEKQEYIIIPFYQNVDILKIELDGIFNLEIANIIDIVKLLIRKGRVKKDNDGASNRKTYAYGNE